MANRALKVIASDYEMSRPIVEAVTSGRLLIIRHCGVKTFNEICIALGLYSHIFPNKGNDVKKRKSSV